MLGPLLKVIGYLTRFKLSANHPLMGEFGSFSLLMPTCNCSFPQFLFKICRKVGQPAPHRRTMHCKLYDKCLTQPGNLSTRAVIYRAVKRAHKALIDV